MLDVLSVSRSSYPPRRTPPLKSHFFLNVTDYGRQPVDDYAARMIGLKQTFQVKRVALFVSMQELLLLVKDTGGDVCNARARRSTL